MSEITTNAVQITQADGRDTQVRRWLLAGQTRLLILVRDASPLPPVRRNTSGDAENGRGLLLAETLSTRWGFFAGPVLTHSDWTPDTVLISADRAWLIDWACPALGASWTEHQKSDYR